MSYVIWKNFSSGLIKKIPFSYHIDLGESSSIITNLEFLDKPSHLKHIVYDPRELFKSLKEREEYIDYLRTPYFGKIVVLMRDALILIATPGFEEPEAVSARIVTDNLEVAKKYESLINWVEKTENDEISYEYLIRTLEGYKSERIFSKNKRIDIDKNYNSDLPLPRIQEFIYSSSPGLVIFNGEPGTGKSSFLKYLISKYSDKEWVIIPSSTLRYTSETHLVSYFSQSRNRIYILEDCEKLILRRESGNDLDVFLNLTDGLLGDALCTKFICTFNTPLSNVDPALLRKGRLTLRYEFKKLSLEKTKILKPDATSPMTLADIYNSEENGGMSNHKKLGYT